MMRIAAHFCSVSAVERRLPVRVAPAELLQATISCQPLKGYEILNIHCAGDLTLDLSGEDLLAGAVRGRETVIHDVCGSKG